MRYYAHLPRHAEVSNAASESAAHAERVAVGSPPGSAVARNWRVEDAVNRVRRLLGLAYFWVGSANGAEPQLWATWLLSAALVDLSDAVADALNQPFAALSLEMVYRSLYIFTGAYQRGEASDPIAYLAAKADRIGIIKRRRKITSSGFKGLTLTLASGP